LTESHEIFASISLLESKGLKDASYREQVTIAFSSLLLRAIDLMTVSLHSTVPEKTKIYQHGNKSHYFIKSIAAETFKL